MYLRVPNGKGAGDGLIGGPGGDGHHGTAFMHRESERGKNSNDVCEKVVEKLAHDVLDSVNLLYM